MTMITSPTTSKDATARSTFVGDLVKDAFRPERVQATAVKLVTLGLLIWGWASIDNFLSATNINAIMYSMAAVGIAAVGMAFITLSGNLFMLSMGATAAISTVLFASILHIGLAATVPVVMLVGAGIGLVQGVAVGIAGANPIIATIAISSIVMGFGAWYSGGLTIVGEGDASWLAVGKFLSFLPNQVVLFFLIAFAADFIVQRSRFGRELRLIGLNRDAAMVAGLRIARTLVIAFVIAGMLAALSGALFASQAAQGNLKLGAGIDFDAIAAVLVGGVSIRGGHGRILDAAFGAAFLAVVGNILLVEGLPIEVQLAVKGMVVILAVVFGALVGGKKR
ncbi:Ribose import permease protein RbsC [compost metagenome]